MKDQLKEGDVIVVIFPDHGSRYVAKIYNDEWMRDRGWLVMKTVRDIIESRMKGELISIPGEKTVADAVSILTGNDIDQMPVMQNGTMIGSINETGLLAKLMENHAIKSFPCWK
jgi:cystathionine beta-synthase